jgi:hypothetical protein
MSQPAPPQFQPRQILCLEHEQSKLYAEVIQVVPDRPVCWLRPMILEVEISPNLIPHPDLATFSQNYHPTDSPYQTTTTQETNQVTTQLKTYDLRLSSDLLLPPSLFRPALDTEVIPLLGQINGTEFNLEEAQNAHHLLRDFIRKIWQQYREAFPS